MKTTLKALALAMTLLGSIAMADEGQVADYRCTPNDPNDTEIVSIHLDGDKMHVDADRFLGDYHQDNTVGVLPRFQGYKGLRHQKMTANLMISQAAVGLSLIRGEARGELHLDTKWYRCEAELK